MRKKLNDNPVVQVAMIGVLLVLAAFFVSTRVLHKSSSETPKAAAVAGSAPVVTSAPTGAVDPAAALAGADSVPSPPLPRPLIGAYRRGATIVLLVVRGGGIDDRMMIPAVRRLKRTPGLAVFVATAERISRYAAITQGVGVDRVPALVVVRPRALSGGGPATASVSYGFESASGVVQAVNDALYHGPTVSYAPN